MTVPSGVCASAPPATATRASTARTRLWVHFRCAYIWFLLSVDCMASCLLRHAGCFVDLSAQLGHHLRSWRQGCEHRPADVRVSLPRRWLLHRLAVLDHRDQRLRRIALAAVDRVLEPHGAV